MQIKKILFLLAFFLFGLFSFVSETKAVPAPPRPIEPDKVAVDCAYFTFDPQVNEYLFVIKNNITESFEVLQENKCYKDFFINVFWKKNLPKDFSLTNADLMNEILYSDFDSDKNYYLGAVGLPVWVGSWGIVKEKNPTKSITANMNIQSVILNTNTKKMKEFKSVSTFKLVYKNNKQKQIDEDEFNRFIKDYAPHYKYSNFLQYIEINYSVQIWWLILFLLTVLVESVIFYFFGSRSKRNYFYLFLANIVSCSLAICCVYILGTFSFVDLIEQIIFIWFFVELLVFLIEHMIIWIALRKYYSKSQIVLFVFIANLVTALIGLGIFLCLYYFNLLFILF